MQTHSILFDSHVFIQPSIQLSNKQDILTQYFLVQISGQIKHLCLISPHHGAAPCVSLVISTAHLTFLF